MNWTKTTAKWEIFKFWDLVTYIRGLTISVLSHWGRVTHICVGEQTIIGSDNGLSSDRRQAIIWTYAGILLIQPWGTNFSEKLIEIDVFSFKKMHLKMSSAKWLPFCLGLNVLRNRVWFIIRHSSASNYRQAHWHTQNRAPILEQKIWRCFTGISLMAN